MTDFEHALRQVFATDGGAQMTRSGGGESGDCWALSRNFWIDPRDEQCHVYLGPLVVAAGSGGFELTSVARIGIAQVEVAGAQLTLRSMLRGDDPSVTVIEPAGPEFALTVARWDAWILTLDETWFGVATSCRPVEARK